MSKSGDSKKPCWLAEATPPSTIHKAEILRIGRKAAVWCEEKNVAMASQVFKNTWKSLPRKGWIW